MTWVDHLHHLQDVLSELRCDPKEMSSGANLGYRISWDLLMPQEKKVECVFPADDENTGSCLPWVGGYYQRASILTFSR